jgi:choline-phosphate cytidylyltransferase
MIAHDTLPYKTPEKDDCYYEFKISGRFLPTLRTEGISTSSILTRILKERV